MSSHVLPRLHEDHARFELFFKAIEIQCKHLELGEPADMARLRAINAYLSKYALPRHHAFEDAIFAQIVKHVPHLRTDIFDLVEDHHASRRELRNFVRAVENGAGDIAQVARSFIAHERAHFISEEEIIFRFAAIYLTSDQWRALEENKSIDSGEKSLPPNLEPIADLLA